MRRKHQRGELSLAWCAIFVALVACVALAALFSMRYERNLFAEAWAHLTRTSVGQVVQQTQSAVQSAARSEAAAVRKCTINGAVVYSNVDCGPENKTSRKLELHDSRGIEAPKAPPAAEPQAGALGDLKEKRAHD